MFLQEFLYLCLDGVWKEQPGEIVEIKFENLAGCGLF